MANNGPFSSMKALVITLTIYAFSIVPIYFVFEFFLAPLIEPDAILRFGYEIQELMFQVFIGSTLTVWISGLVLSLFMISRRKSPFVIALVSAHLTSVIGFIFMMLQMSGHAVSIAKG